MLPQKDSFWRQGRVNPRQRLEICCAGMHMPAAPAVLSFAQEWRARGDSKSPSIGRQHIKARRLSSNSPAKWLQPAFQVRQITLASGPRNQTSKKNGAPNSAVSAFRKPWSRA
jgi:hypothetical protein